MAIDGDVLLGFGDYFSTDNVGAAAKPKAKPGKPVKKAPVRPYPKVPRKTAMEHHGKVLHASRGVALKAAQTIGKAMHLLAQKPAAKLPPGKTVPAGKTPPAAALHGNVVHVGAVAAAKMTPKAKLAIQKHNAAVVKAAKAAKVLAQHAIKTKKTVQALAKHMVSQKKLAKVMRTKRGAGKPVHVGMLLDDAIVGEAAAEMLGEYYDAVGAAPDPNNPGYLDDGSPDPAFGTTDPSMPMTDPTAGLDAGALTEDPLDDGTTLPAAPDMSTFVADMTTVGGIAYDGSKGTPEGYIVSYGLATRSTDHKTPDPDTAQIDGTEHWGYVFGKYDKLDPPNGGIPWGSNLAAGQWNHVHGRYHLGDSGWWNPVDQSEAFGSNNKHSDRGAAYGPLVGNPAMKDFAAMRVDGRGNCFWFPQEAPDWLTFPIKQAAALTAQAAKKAADDAAAADAAAQQKASADAAAAQAAQDAANALAESQATSQAKVDQAAAETQAQQAIVQQQQADTQQQTVDTEQQKQAGTIMLQQASAQAAQDQQVQAMIIDQAKREQSYLAQHPEEEFAPEPQGDDEAVATDDTMDDGSDMPGGDMMQDSDGEGFPSDDDLLSSDDEG